MFDLDAIVKVAVPLITGALAYAAAVFQARIRKEQSIGEFTEAQLKLLIEQQNLEMRRLREENASLAETIKSLHADRAKQYLPKRS